ncbi:MAG: Signal transduction histidine kinase CheA [Candidatus Rifleibacterium amylolyticum]|nr:MAG: Signal transduction histidine kinase CheA [Candidatus Rifleibacterium amylolyticum]
MSNVNDNPYIKGDGSELLQCYLAESIEHLEGIEPLLLQLETASTDEKAGIINQVFRAAHSIKGSSGMFGFTRIHELSHRIEWLLDSIRSCQISISADLIDLLLSSFDRLRYLIDHSANSNEIDISAVCNQLDEILETVKTPKAESSAVAGRAQPTLFSLPWQEIADAQSSGWKVFFGRIDLVKDIDEQDKSLCDFFKYLDSFGTLVLCEFDFAAFEESASANAYRLPFEFVYYSEMEAEELADMLEVPARVFYKLESQAEKSVSDNQNEDIDSAAMAQSLALPASNGILPVQVEEKSEPTLRVKVSLLEDLMNLAGELVLSRNQLREGLNRNDMRAIRISGQRMGQVTTELQETIMMTRLQPLDRVFSKFPRMIRDLSRQLGKEISLTMEGREVELDKALIEGLGDPLTHMVRNAVDHGVEAPQERQAIGKSNPARIKIQAFYEASRVIIEVSDDGRGIDGDKVCAKAVERGLLALEKARSLSSKEKQNLVFMPGLSTAEKVSELSGRGVGMDVVKANIDSLGGKVEIISELGRGSSFRIKLPLTLAIIPSLILSTSGEIFAIPQLNVVEMLMIPAEMVKRKIEVIGDQEVLVLRGKLLPLISLNSFLGGERNFSDSESGKEKRDRRRRLADRRSPHYQSNGVISKPDVSDLPQRENGRRYHAASDINVVIVTTGSFSYGIVVDKPLFTEEIVVKQLGSDLKGLAEYSGATIMGDGRIALIIDVFGLATRANIMGQQHTISTAMVETTVDSRLDADTVPFLAFRYGGPQTLVLPLFLVDRLEKVQLREIVACGGWKAIQHGDKILPVFMVSDITDIEPLRNDQECGVIVIRVRDREIGLIAALPIQVIELNPAVDNTVLRQPGIGGSMAWGSKSVLFVDIWEILARQRPELLDFSHESAYTNERAPELLVLEPSDYFSNQLRLQLENHGYAVKLVRSWREIDDCLAAEVGYKALMADARVLQRDNFANIRRLRAEKKLNGTRVVALRNSFKDCDNDLTTEGIVEVFQKLENQNLAEWLNSALPTGLEPIRESNYREKI